MYHDTRASTYNSIFHWPHVLLAGPACNSVFHWPAPRSMLAGPVFRWSLDSIFHWPARPALLAGPVFRWPASHAYPPAPLLLQYSIGRPGRPCLPAPYSAGRPRMFRQRQLHVRIPIAGPAPCLALTKLFKAEGTAANLPMKLSMIALYDKLSPKSVGARVFETASKMSKRPAL